MLPNHKQAYIPKPKLKEYLLSEAHAVGKAKAKCFRSLGYTKANADELANALLMMAKSNKINQEVSAPFSAPYGTKWYKIYCRRGDCHSHWSYSAGYYRLGG